MLNFAATVAGAGLAAIVLVANLQGAPLPKDETTRAGATLLDPMTITSIPAAPEQRPTEAIRLIDLRSGATCRMPYPHRLSESFSFAPVGPDCQGSPDLARVTKWRRTAEGYLEMADAGERPVLRFMPGDGVLYESVYPAQAIVTIVPAKS